MIDLFKSTLIFHDASFQNGILEKYICSNFADCTPLSFIVLKNILLLDITHLSNVTNLNHHGQ